MPEPRNNQLLSRQDKSRPVEKKKGRQWKELGRKITVRKLAVML